MVIITPLFITGVFLFYYQNHSKTEILENYKNLTTLANDFFRQSIEDSYKKLEYLAEIKTDNQKDFLEEVKNTLYLNPQFTFIALLDKQGKNIVSVNTQEDNFSVDLSSFPYLKNISDKQVALGPLEIKEGGTIPVLYPRSDGKYLFALIDIIPIMQKIESQEFGKSGGFYFINKDGEIVSFGANLLPDITSEEIKTILKESFLIKKICARDNTAFVGAWQKTIIPQTYLALLQYRKEAFWNINLITWLIAFFILATTTLSYFAALVFSQEVSKPVEDLTKAARKIASNNFDIDLSSCATWGEFKILTNTFKEMALRLKNYQAMQLDKILDEKKKMDLLVSLLRDGLIMCSLKGKKLFANDRANFILQSGVLGKNISEEKILLEDILKQKQNKIISVSKDNKELFFEIIRDTFKPAKSQAVGIILFRDITYEHQINQMKESVFNAIAHDLRAPLLGLQGYLMLLENTSLTDKQKEMLDNMEKSSQTLTSLIENILDISKLEKGLLKLNKTTFNLKDCARQVINELSSVAINKQIKIENIIDEKVQVKGDAQLIKRVFSNLISNAIKFTKEGKIVISYTNGKVRVKDTGIGIDPAQLKKIFEKYNKGDSKEKGYGLGLNISRHIINAHGGTIEAQNNKEGGASFLFSVEEVL
jgi:signal transduction histidine kinase